MSFGLLSIVVAFLGGQGFDWLWVGEFSGDCECSVISGGYRWQDSQVTVGG